MFISLFDDKIIAYNKEVRIDCRKRKITLIGNNKLIITLNATNELIEIDKFLFNKNIFFLKIYT